MNVSLLIELTKRDFTERFSGYILGVGWSIIWPLVSIFIYPVIFSKIMAARLPRDGGAFSDWWLSLYYCATEPLFRPNLESRGNQQAVEQCVSEIKILIRGST